MSAAYFPEGDEEDGSFDDHSTVAVNGHGVGDEKSICMTSHEIRRHAVAPKAFQ